MAAAAVTLEPDGREGGTSARGHCTWASPTARPGRRGGTHSSTLGKEPQAVSAWCGVGWGSAIPAAGGMWKSGWFPAPPAHSCRWPPSRGHTVPALSTFCPNSPAPPPPNALQVTGPLSEAPLAPLPSSSLDGAAPAENGLPWGMWQSHSPTVLFLLPTRAATVLEITESPR